MYEYNTVNVEILNSIAVVKFNRPKALNALSTEMTKELSDLFDKLAVNDSVRGIILTGEGKAFMAGADITEMKEWGAFEGREFARLSNRAFSKIAEIGKPTVGAVNGFALGGGLEIALCCDWRIASENAVFGQTGPRVGSFDAGFGASYLARVVGQKKAREIWFLCRKYNAQEALDMGLVNKVVPLERLEDEYVQWAEEMMLLSPLALRMIKAGLNAELDGQSGIQELAGDATLLYYLTDEAQEGKNAFLEKRKPNFKQYPKFP